MAGVSHQTVVRLVRKFKQRTEVPVSSQTARAVKVYRIFCKN